MFKVYPGQRTGGIEADMMAANELNAHAFLQSSSKGLCENLVVLVGGFETKTGEQVFRYQMPESIMLLFSFIRIKMSLFCAVACFSE